MSAKAKAGCQVQRPKGRMYQLTASPSERGEDEVDRIKPRINKVYRRSAKKAASAKTCSRGWAAIAPARILRPVQTPRNRR